jgi:hypothetical protein
MPRNYKQEYANYQGQPAQIANRTKRNAARSEMEKRGAVSKGDGKDVDHRTPIAKGGGNGNGNLRAVPKSQNRSFARTKTARMK